LQKMTVLQVLHGLVTSGEGFAVVIFWHLGQSLQYTSSWTAMALHVTLLMPPLPCIKYISQNT
jgi:hypothetical protein